ncbi:MFS transporter [Microbulbifer sp. ZKSA002]|uniref:MFS transporter n=1 Tax=unclassified Microbulbifer TaxID=2619833 RepID=UPI004039A8E7
MTSLAPFKNKLFLIIWTATLISNTGTWIHEIGANWLMISLTSSPFWIAMVQSAASLPTLFLAIPAGAFADIVDKKRYLIILQIWMFLLTSILCLLTATGSTSILSLLTLTFLIGIGTALMVPVWSSITPLIVTKADLPQSIALNSMGINLARVIGPILGGVLLIYFNLEVLFALNAISFLCVIIALSYWTPNRNGATIQHSENFVLAIKNNLKYIKRESKLQHALVRALSFFIFASALWALLPTFSSQLYTDDPKAYSLLMSFLGLGAVSAVFFTNKLRTIFKVDNLLCIASIGYATSMLLLSFLTSYTHVSVAMFTAGFCWLLFLSPLILATQEMLPNWIRARGMSFFMATYMGAMAIGGMLWGKTASYAGTSNTLLIASCFLLVATVFVRNQLVGPADQEALNIP